MSKIAFLFCLLTIGYKGYSQSEEIDLDWKQILTNNSFAITHNENDIPENIFKILAIDGIISFYDETTGKGAKLCWAAYDDEGNWILAIKYIYSSRGKEIRYYLLSSKNDRILSTFFSPGLVYHTVPRPFDVFRRKLLKNRIRYHARF